MIIKRIVKGIIILLPVMLVCFPIAMLAIASFKSSNELYTMLSPILSEADGYLEWSWLVRYPTAKHFYKLLLLTPEFYQVFLNSVKIVLLILAGQAVISMPAAWAFAHFRFKGRRILFTLYVVLMILPFQVTMLSSYLVLDSLALVNTHAAVILPTVFSTFPVFIMYRGFSQIPVELVEAARIDGAGEWMIFFKIAIPIGSSGVLAALILGFLEYWNMIEQPLVFLKDKSLWPMSLYLPEINMSQAGLAFAASVIILIPAVFVFILGQNYLEDGITASAIKE